MNQFGLLTPPVDGATGQLGQAQQVPKLNALTSPFPVVPTEPVVYKSEFGNLTMHRTDGKKIVFRQGYFTADTFYDQEYLNNEIKEGTPGIRLATPEEVEQAKFAANPLKATAERAAEETKRELAASFQEELERAKAAMQASFESQLSAALKAAGVNAGDGGRDLDKNDPSQSGSQGAVESVGGVTLKLAATDAPKVQLLTPQQGAAARLGVGNTSSIAGGTADSNTK